MRTFRQILQQLADGPRGFVADGRPIGLGLSAALHAQQVQCDADLAARTAVQDARRHETIDSGQYAGTR